MLHTFEPLEDVAPDSSIIGPVILVIGWWTVVLLLWHQQLVGTAAGVVRYFLSILRLIPGFGVVLYAKQ
jgi:hypothetical protein